MADCMCGLSIGSWLEHWLPREELNHDDLLAELTNKRFDFHGVIFHGREGESYITFDLSREDFVFLKDNWCPDTNKIVPDYAIYEILKIKDPGLDKYFATMCCGGDVLESVRTGGQRTRSQKHMKKGTRVRIHYRLVLNEIAHHMSNYMDTHGLTTVVLCALHGMFDSFAFSPLPR